MLPESMGNTRLVLPNGVVCDRCNNGSLSVLDQAICDFFPLKARRTMLGVRSKAGKIPVTRFNGGQLSSPREATVSINVDSSRDTTTFQETSRHDGVVSFQMQMRGGHKMTPRYCSTISRALLKTALECAWFDHDESTLNPAFDDVRAIVLGEPWDGFLIVARQGDPDDNGTELGYFLRDVPGGQSAVTAAARYFGVTMLTDSHLAEPAHPLALEPHAIVIPFTAAESRKAA